MHPTSLNISFSLTCHIWFVLSEKRNDIDQQNKLRPDVHNRPLEELIILQVVNKFPTRIVLYCGR